MGFSLSFEDFGATSNVSSDNSNQKMVSNKSCKGPGYHDHGPSPCERSTIVFGETLFDKSDRRTVFHSNALTFGDFAVSV
jgi:hypothetical protein